MLQLILIVKLVTCEMHSKIKFFNQKPTNEIGRPHYTPLVTNSIFNVNPLVSLQKVYHETQIMKDNSQRKIIHLTVVNHSSRK